MIQLEVEGDYRCSRQEVESLIAQIESVNRELVIENEMVENLKQELDTKTTEFDTVRDELFWSLKVHRRNKTKLWQCLWMILPLLPLLQPRFRKLTLEEVRLEYKVDQGSPN